MLIYFKILCVNVVKPRKYWCLSVEKKYACRLLFVVKTTLTNAKCGFVN